ncbi:MAG: hypothetical protein ACON5H_11695 [Akkermansiaceae bacterium]
MDKNPHLPSVSQVLGPSHTRRHRRACGPEFRQACLEFAQSLWLEGKPAQAILQLNKSAFAESCHPFPYSALRWFLEQENDAQFFGNPVRHFQHLATRMAGPRAELRIWQAWACFHLSKSILPGTGFPPDFEQIAQESLSLPSLETVLQNLPPPDRTAFLASLTP